MLTGRAGAQLTGAIGMRAVPDDACVLAGARDLDPLERALLDASAVRRIDDVAALASAALPPAPWYVHLDVDVIDPSELPALRFPAPRGPSAHIVEGALRALAARGTIAALGLACTLAPQAFAGVDPLERIRPLIDAALGSSSNAR